ncbi:hypothetical protein B711_0644 [Chlamydia psittaci CP3]|nr:hypothetical protein B599_0603 [Chlamydia psittaci MN]AFS27042.1 hypothetical protein B711_0644 [Chlamydia psittaci CP3]EPJ24721.1 hypothetical protein CP09DC77_1024 [Chlamydia psittaci 09DC77]EPJ26492.1 hypothetical protein CP09DC80_1021 [Chlamydia psittaci 09DC80]EPJ29619.1 hypothetical protein CP09DC78_1017 [Chlamydia psittaci 09DC78]EPL01252.1 hypothetical protein CP09DC79_0737 [Chlamydia psittaci 09DC79]
MVVGGLGLAGSAGLGLLIFGGILLAVMGLELLLSLLLDQNNLFLYLLE